eukprot:6492610-Amphidinium_carterae.4
MSSIKAKLAGRLEWQLLVLENIESWEQEEKGQRPPSRKKSAEDLDLQAIIPQRPEIAPSDKLGRSGKRYSGWLKPIMIQVLAYLEPAKFPVSQKKLDSIDIMKQVLEFSTGVRCTDAETSDHSSSIMKLATFESLLSLYMARGQMASTLVIKESQIDWTTDGIYIIDSSVAGCLEVWSRVHKCRKRIPEEVIDGREGGLKSFTDGCIRKNFSEEDAFISMRDGKQFKLKSLYPQHIVMGRKLKKRLSDELGATAPPPPALCDATVAGDGSEGGESAVKRAKTLEQTESPVDPSLETTPPTRPFAPPSPGQGEATLREAVNAKKNLLQQLLAASTPVAGGEETASGSGGRNACRPSEKGENGEDDEEEEENENDADIIGSDADEL